MDKKAKVDAETVKAVQKFDKHSIAAQERGAHHLTKANAIQAGRAVPAKTAKALKGGK